MKYYYAVHVGRKQGVFSTWNECEQQVKAFSGSKYKKFTSFEEAECFVLHGFYDENRLKRKLNNSLEPCYIKKQKTVSSDECQPNCQHMQSLCSNGKPSVSNSKHLKFKPVLNPDEVIGAASVADGEQVVVYTDGACSKNGKKGCRAGYGVWWGDNHCMNLSCKLEGVQTNQRAEIAAVNAAIKQAQKAGIPAITVRTDSMFVINCMTKWLHKWKKNKWIKADGNPVVHKAEFQEMIQNMKNVSVTFEHVPAHTGVHGNEMADRLAIAGITR